LSLQRLYRCYSSGNCEVSPTGNGKLETAIEPFETRSFHPVLSGSVSIFLFYFVLFLLIFYLFIYFFFNLGQSRIDSHKRNRGRTRPALLPPRFPV
jgi:hypothetical protein